MLYYIKLLIPFLRKHPPYDLQENGTIRLILMNIMISSLLQFSHFHFRCDTSSRIIF